MANEGELQSLEASMSLAVQSAKGTAATTKFITALATDSGLFPQLDIEEKGAEHGQATANARPTRQRSRNRRGGYLAAGSLGMNLYARALPILLAGAGFAISTSDDTTHYTHTMTIADRDAASWLTVLHEFGARELRATDCRLDNLEIGGDPSILTATANIQGLTTSDSAGTETKTDEYAVEMLPSTGTITMLLDPDGTATEIAYSGGEIAASMNEMLTIENPLDTEQRRMHKTSRAGLPQTGLGVMWASGGFDVDWEIYDAIIRGSAAGTEPSMETALASLNYSYESAANISGASVPYSFDVTIPYMEINMDEANFTATGEETVRWAFNAEMLDDVSLLSSTEPITIVVVNDVAAY